MCRFTYWDTSCRPPPNPAHSPLLKLRLSLSFSFSPPLSFCLFVAAVDSGPTDRSRFHTRPEEGSPSLFALFYFPRPTRFSMSTTRALLPRPAAHHAPHVIAVAAVGKLLLSRISHPHHWEVPSRLADGIERRESRRRRRRRTCGRVGVALASLR